MLSLLQLQGLNTAVARLKDTTDTNACTQMGHLVCILALGRPTVCLQAVHDTTACG